jgi:tetratricopeptide (TPR) repeat protein
MERRKMDDMAVLRIGRLAAATSLLFSLAASALANPESQALRAKAAAELYNLDRDQALQTFKQAVVADPQDAGAYRGLAAALWLSITFRRGNMTVDDYLGRVTKPNSKMAPPPPETAAAFADAIDRALALARTRLATNEKDTDAHYQVGSAVGLRASYAATVDGSTMGAFRSAREAYEEHERVLQLDASRKDAGLIVGTYRYIVSMQALPVRLMAYLSGFGGDSQRGLRMIEEAARYPGDNQADARFALILVYNREKRYDDALTQLAVLRERYPRNRLAWLESGSTSLRAGHAADAERFIDEGFRRFSGDTRQRMFGEDALWLYKRGTARAALGKNDAAEQDLRKAVSSEGRPWVYGRAHLELGKLALKRGERQEAQTELQTAIRLCDGDNDAMAADEARKLARF